MSLRVKFELNEVNQNLATLKNINNSIALTAPLFDHTPPTS